MSRWSNEEEHLVRTLLADGINLHTITEEFARRRSTSTPGFSDKRTGDAIHKKMLRDHLDGETYQSPYRKRWEAIEKVATKHRLQREVKNTGVVANPTRKILTISDLHFPFAREDLIEQTINKHSDADVVVVNGDIVDGYIFSTFEKSKRVPANHEYMMAFNLVHELSERFPKVVLTSGNHDVRAARALGRAGFDADAVQALRPDMIARIANGEEIDELGEIVKKHNFTNVIYQHPETWWVQIGKTIFAHPHGWSGGPGGTVQKLDQIFSNRFGTDHFDSVVIGHTHRCFWGVANNHMLIEQGSMSARQDYEHKANLKFAHAMNGYAVIYQDEEGNTDFSTSRPYYLGSELPAKKKIVI